MENKITLISFGLLCVAVVCVSTAPPQLEDFSDGVENTLEKIWGRPCLNSEQCVDTVSYCQKEHPENVILGSKSIEELVLKSANVVVGRCRLTVLSWIVLLGIGILLTCFLICCCRCC